MGTDGVPDELSGAFSPGLLFQGFQLFCSPVALSEFLAEFPDNQVLKFLVCPEPGHCFLSLAQHSGIPLFQGDGDLFEEFVETVGLVFFQRDPQFFRNEVRKAA